MTTPAIHQANERNGKEGNIPRCIELDKHILCVIVYYIFKRLPNKSVNSLSLLSRDGLTLQRWLELVVKIFLNPISKSIRRHILGLIIWVFELLFHILDDKGRPFGLLEVKSLGVVAKLDGINPDEIHLGFVFRGNGFQQRELPFLVFTCGINEEVGKGFRTGRVNRIVVTTDFVKNGNSEFLEPVFKVMDSGWRNGIGIFRTWFIITTIDENSRRSYVGCLDDTLIGN